MNVNSVGATVALNSAQKFLYAGFSGGVWGLCVGYVVMVCALQLAGKSSYLPYKPNFAVVTCSLLFSWKVC